MGFLDGLKKNLGFDKAVPKAAERAPGAPQEAAEPSAGETVQSPGPDASGDAGAVAEPDAVAADALPEGAARASADAASAGRVTEVVVETDDTLSGIAMQFGVDLDALIAVNADTVPNPDHIYPGQVLRLP
ncbi:LysM peptidoglycan-binding domain-containing protein [Arthrobacter sp. MMS18-M83]|uniref:LysM peptidoglycan-binding domain-containing protein n=1 Tax=Arthrobacter sp. MMS18-M83 TaxID=2996261 RepID=UPI00227BB8E8|nr:LysM peptidoglycan-binding domain-containing protein [Arthrobacter sp. MMS18-M83]WAH96019.1 LysM peptidoglycan-binding domain-containing protein [Arthrobacter sp. MMS18-M83]